MTYNMPPKVLRGRRPRLTFANQVMCSLIYSLVPLTSATTSFAYVSSLAPAALLQCRGLSSSHLCLH